MSDIGQPQVGQVESTRRGLNVEADSKKAMLCKKGSKPFLFGDVLTVASGTSEVVVFSGTGYDSTIITFNGRDGVSGSLVYNDDDRYVAIAGSAGSVYNVNVMLGSPCSYYKAQIKGKTLPVPSLP